MCHSAQTGVVNIITHKPQTLDQAVICQGHSNILMCIKVTKKFLWVSRSILMCVKVTKIWYVSRSLKNFDVYHSRSLKYVDECQGYSSCMSRSLKLHVKVTYICKLCLGPQVCRCVLAVYNVDTEYCYDSGPFIQYKKWEKFGR